ncbi:MAG: c-type cytochrome [Thermoanaerobaculia bacterium]
MKIRIPLLILVGYASLAAAAFKPSGLFVKKCAKCHGEDGRADTPKGRKMKAQDFTESGFQERKTDAQLIDAVTNGTEKDMPPFGKVLSADEIETLVKEDVRGFAKK